VTQRVTDQRRQALGEFIRSRRERTTPEMVGMPPTLRRRTPGLRREELALLSGIGVTWYTWLEQGRPINVSTQVLGAICRVLRLDAAERAHLFALAELADPQQTPQPPAVGPAVQAVLAALEPVPATVVGPHWELLASNRAYLALTGDYRTLPCRYRNTLLLYFCEIGWRDIMGDWAANAPRLVAKVRTAMAADVADPGWQQLLELLHAHSPEFRELWQRHDVAAIDSMHKVLHHEQVGVIRTEVLHSWLTDQRGARLTVYTPSDEAARSAYERLCTVTPRAMQIPGVETESALLAA
jgi:transcriptional regulator with XRE-family HTH domain